MERGIEGVKADLSELGQEILGLARLFQPVFGAFAGNGGEAPPSPAHEEGPNPVPCPSLNAAAAVRGRSEGGGNGGGGGGGVRDEIVQFIRELMASPESWQDSPAMMNTNTEFVMSDVEREHVALVDRLVPDLPALIGRLCPSLMPESAFWTMYFARVHPELDTRQSEILLSIDKLLEEMQERHNPEPQPAVAESSSSVTKEKSGDSEQEADQPQVRPTSTEATTVVCLDNWFDTSVLRETDASTETRQRLSSRDGDSYGEQEGNAVALLKRNRFPRSIEAVDRDNSLISSNEWLRLSQSDHEQALEKLPGKMFTWDESDWHADEDDLEYEFV